MIIFPLETRKRNGVTAATFKTRFQNLYFSTTCLIRPERVVSAFRCQLVQLFSFLVKLKLKPEIRAQFGFACAALTRVYRPNNNNKV